MSDVALFALAGLVLVLLSVLAIVFLGGGAYMLALFGLATGVVLLGIAYDRRSLDVERSSSGG